MGERGNGAMQGEVNVARASLYQALVETASDGVAAYGPLVDEAGEVVDLAWLYVNPAGLAILDRTPDDLLGRAVLETHPQVGGLEFHERLLAVHRQREPFAMVASFDPIHVARTFAIRGGEVDGMVVIRIRDVTEDRLLRRRERATEERLSALLSSITDGILVMSRDWKIEYVNDAACRTLGRERRDLLDRALLEAFPDADASGFEAQYRRALDEDVPVSFEAYYPPPLDTWYSVRGYPSSDGLLVIFQDVGPQRRLQERVTEAQRLESIATLAGGIAHDYNNLLTVVSGHAMLLADDLADDDPNLVDVKAIQGAADRATELTRQLLTFSRRQVIQPETADLNALVEEALPVLHRIIDGRSGSVALHLGLHPEGILIEADPREVNRALVNLVNNACDAVEGSGNVVIETARIEVAEGDHSWVTDLDPGAYGVLSISDDGAGMPPEVVARAREPFFTTKPAGVGTGLGLSGVDGMAKQIGGHLSIYSEAGIGTTVRLYLPRSDLDASVDADPLRDREVAGIEGDEAVLVVDDDDRVRRFVARVLGDLGYRVTERRDVDGALEALEATSAGFDLVVTDMIMPGRPGHELARILRAQRSTVPVLFTSGFTDAEVIGGTVGTYFLPKPFDPRQLGTAVRRLLDAAGGEGGANDRSDDDGGATP